MSAETPTQPPSARRGKAPPPARDTVEILGVPIDRVTNAQALERMLALCKASGGPHLVLTPNADHLIRAARDPKFKALCREGALVIADGQSVVWASRLLGNRLPERVAGSDLMPQSATAAARQGLRYFFIGGSPGDAEQAARVLAARAGADGICGVECPPLGFELDQNYVDDLVARINHARPDLIYVGLGSPKQERFMLAIRPRVRASVLMAVGVSFSFVAGTVKRAPRWMRKVGLEWLWRVLCEPRRLWKRYAENLVVFPWLVMRERVARSR